MHIRFYEVLCMRNGQKIQCHFRINIWECWYELFDASVEFCLNGNLLIAQWNLIYLQISSIVKNRVG